MPDTQPQKDHRMIPTPVEWRSWRALDKATYLAQLIAPVSLLVSSIFSYLSWTEARQAREAQEKFFTAEKGPKINVAHARMTTVSDGEKAVSLDLSNSGDTAAYDYCVSITDNDLKQFAGTCGQTGPIAHIGIDRRGSFPYTLPIRDDMQKVIGFVPKSIIIIDPNKDKRCKGKVSNVIIVTSTYKDIVGDRHGGLDQLLLCG